MIDQPGHGDHRESEIHDHEPLKDAESAKSHIRKINKIAAADYEAYQKAEAADAFKDKPRRIILFCSDGRIDVSMFFSNPFERFRHAQLPMAGNRWIASEDFQDCADTKTLDAFYREHQEDLNGLFEYMFGKILKENPDIVIELQSHSESPDSFHHGCGAHKSDTASALKETAKLAYLMEKWNHRAKIVRTHNFTKPIEIVPAADLDANAMDASGSKIGIGDLAELSVRYDINPKILKQQTGRRVIVKGKNNHFGIDTENHAEQTILISNTPLAHHGGGRQALRMAWHEDPEFMTNFIRILMGIIKSNYLKRNPGAPIILHFDIPDGEEITHEDGGKTAINKKVLAEQLKILELMHKDPQIQQMFESGQLLVVTTITNPETYKTQIYQ